MINDNGDSWQSAAVNDPALRLAERVLVEAAYAAIDGDIRAQKFLCTRVAELIADCAGLDPNTPRKLGVKLLTSGDRSSG